MSDRSGRPEDSTPFERRAKDAFDESAAKLDAATRSRLTQARHRALEELPAARARRGWHWSALPAGAAAAVAVAVVLYLRGVDPISEPNEQQAVLGDLEILLDEGDLEMYDEEIEFYAWLEQQPDFEPPAETGDGVG